MIAATVNHLWQSTIFAGLAALVAFGLRNYRAQTRYWVWWAASIKFVIPLAALVALGHTLSGLRPAIPRPLVQVPGFVEQVSQPFPSSAIPRLAPKTARGGIRAEPLILTVWGLGVLGIFLNWGIRAGRLRSAWRGARSMPIEARIPVLCSPALLERGLEPGVFGILRPVLLLPEGIENRLTAEQLAAVIDHECCHARRRDNLTAAFHMAIQALCWFHPLVWWIGGRLIQERERACDEDVVRKGSEPDVYAQGILNVCKLYLESPLLCVSGVTGADLKRRITEIMSGAKMREIGLAGKTLLASGVAAVFAVPVVIGLVTSSRAFAQTITAQYTFGMQTSSAKTFEVATIKPGQPEDTGWFLHPPEHGGIVMENMELHKIVASSFRIQDSMVIGPSWLDSTRYTIVGKGADPTAQNPVVWEMTRSLLRDRFQLQYHIEPRERPVYALVVAKGGHKLKRPEDGPCAPAIARGEHCANLRFGPVNLGITNMPVGAIIGGLGRIMQDRPIVDKTGLTGFYDMDVSWLPDGFKEPGAGGGTNGFDVGAMMTALQEQAGLKLEATKAPVDFLVIDRIEKPGEN